MVLFPYQMIDKVLIDKCQARDEKAVQQLYQYCYVSTFSICLRYQSDQMMAESVFNQAFMKVLSKLDTYDPQYGFKSWLKRIVINCNIDEFRKNRRVKELITYQEVPEKNHPSTQFTNYAQLNFTAEELTQLIRTLPPMTRKVFNLYAIDDYTHREVADMLDITEATSKWHLFSARKKLVEKMEKEMERRKIVGYEK